MTAEARFRLLQARAQVLAQLARNRRQDLAYHYQQVTYAPAGQRRALDRLQARARAAEQRLYDYLEIISPRAWTAGVPCHWIVEALTYGDAITAGQLSVVPPAAYGYTTADSARFAQPITDRRAP